MNSSAIPVFDVAVIGAGPAGIAAAVSASESGARVALLDDNPRPGGQIWRGGPAAAHKGEARSWFDRLGKSPVSIFHNACVFHLEPGALSAESGDTVLQLSYRNLILATGARELFLPFPGWTLPNVMGAGGLQALVKSGLPINDKRVVIAGTGPLLLAVAAYLRHAGAKVLAVCEQAPWIRFLRFGASISLLPGKFRQAAEMSLELAGIPFWANCWPIAAEGKGCLESVQVSRGGKIRSVACDYLACGFHLVPNVELARMAGCNLHEGFVVADDFQRTTVPNIYCAGEPTGIGGLELSLLEGQIAGYIATHWEGAARKLFEKRATFRRAVALLKQSCELRPELKALAKPDTLVCRCEDVSLERLAAHDSWRAAKLQTRCGMGPCQGRVCGAAARFLFDWEMDSARPPVFPVKCSSLAAVGAAAGESNGGSR
jgi:NADPH-dependent 2,4-dienoyl-CoA reductase/sulfur reductase-like enzyme